MTTPPWLPRTVYRRTVAGTVTDDTDDTDVGHLYKGAWHIRPSRVQHPPPPSTEAKVKNLIDK